MQPTTTIREIVGVFHDADALNGAISDLRLQSEMQREPIAIRGSFDRAGREREGK